MWHLNLEKVELALGNELGDGLGAVAVETGTCRGNGTKALAQKFSRVISMELSPALHEESARRLAGLANVRLLQGNSAALLPVVLAELAEEPSVFFFLDAHWSGDSSVPWSEGRWKGYGFDTAHLGAEGTAPSGPEQCPLAEELRAITEQCRGRAVVLIDDAKNLPETGAGARGLEFPGEDWSHLSREGLRAIAGARLTAERWLRDPEQWLMVLRALD
ncbi:MAG: hypothetical protein EOP11_08115 [Proteobacteria bacterium]|nr:MAG: hypothetical protein EOP11_08115 [Pseudomonadota bacterium]